MSRYQQISIIKIDGKRVYQTTRYPEIPLSENDIYVITTQGDRFDTLAYDYYKDQSLWWIISKGNSFLKKNSLICPEGIQIRIPSDVPGILENFNRVNR